MSGDVSVSAREMKALKALAEHHGYSDANYLTFATIARESGLPRKHVRRTVRALARKGLAVYGKGLWTDEGEMFGSGYACTDLGAEVYDRKASTPS